MLRIVDLSISVLISLLFALFLSSARGQDALTPSSPGTQPPESAPLGDVVPLDLDEVAAEILETYSFALGRYDDVVFGRENWKGPDDASLNCSVSFTPTALYVEGDFVDDFPFCQKTIHPAKPKWWKLGYGADGIVITLEDLTSATQRVSFALNWSAQAVHPRVDIIESLLATAPDFARSGCLQLKDTEAPLEKRSVRAIKFRAGVSITELADPQFFEKPLRIVVELYDVDGDYFSASVLRQQQRTANRGSQR
ncbi:MAG: hypothetical protein ACP5QZ_09080 [Candidatus Sumerlaeaceae bacterium]